MKAVFIDRDGVINRDPGGWTKYNYVTKWQDFHFIRAAKKALRMLSDNGYAVVIISNQAGVSKGFYSKDKLEKITRRMSKEVERVGGKITKAYYCIHQDSDRCDCRKPSIGLFRQAEEELGLEAVGSYFIGDSKMDVEAGKSAGMKTVLVLSGKSTVKDASGWQAKPDFIFKDLSEAVKFILKGESI